MLPPHVSYHLAILGLVWLGVLLHYAWPSQGTGSPQPQAEPVSPQYKRKRSNDPNPFAGLAQRPGCAAWAHAASQPQPLPPRRPAPLPPPNRRPCSIDTSMHGCPQAGWAYRGWRGLGNLRANGHPSGSPWRQLSGRSCKRDFLETHGTPLSGQRVAPALRVWAVGALAEGLGMRAVARGGEGDPNTVLQWLVEAADPLTTFSQYFLHAVRGTQVQLDELSALLRAVKAGEGSEAEAIKRLSRSPHGVWVAIAPVSKRLLPIAVGDRTLARAPRVVHQGGQVLAPGCVPRFLPDGCKEDAAALLAHCGQWGQLPRRQAPGPAPRPRWLPLPQLC